MKHKIVYGILALAVLSLLLLNGCASGKLGTWTFDSNYAFYDATTDKCYKEVTTCYGRNVENGALCGDMACDKITCIRDIVRTNVVIDENPEISQMGEDRKMIRCAQYFEEVDQQMCEKIGGMWIPNRQGYDRYNCY